MQTFHFGSRNILELSNAATHDFPDLFQQTFFKKVLIFVCETWCSIENNIKTMAKEEHPIIVAFSAISGGSAFVFDNTPLG